MKADNIEVNTQSSIRIENDKVVYFDPFKIEDIKNDADIIFITHAHYDHMDEESINKVKNDNTIVVAPKSMEEDIKNIEFKDYIFLNPNEESNIDNIIIKTIPAYNIEKPFHSKSNNWLGYVVTINDVTYYVAGDTDENDENKNVKCDIALVPIGGTYTMTATEAADFVNNIKPKVAIPEHYGSIVGTKEDFDVFNDKVNNDIEVVKKLFI